jgi:hypothetical protein
MAIELQLGFSFLAKTMKKLLKPAQTRKEVHFVRKTFIGKVRDLS